MSDALKPCPFCGGTDVREYRHFGDDPPTTYKQCHDCSAMGPDDCEGLNWNTRTPTPPAEVTDAMVEAACATYRCGLSYDDKDRAAMRAAIAAALAARGK
jgi:hypothetical protein